MGSSLFFPFVCRPFEHVAEQKNQNKKRIRKPIMPSKSMGKKIKNTIMVQWLQKRENNTLGFMLEKRSASRLELARSSSTLCSDMMYSRIMFLFNNVFRCLVVYHYRALGEGW
jgi:hypothetical protein